MPAGEGGIEIPEQPLVQDNEPIRASLLSGHSEAINMMAPHVTSFATSQADAVNTGSQLVVLIGNRKFTEDLAKRVTVVVEADVLTASGGSPTGQVVAFERWLTVVLTDDSTGEELELKFNPG